MSEKLGIKNSLGNFFWSKNIIGNFLQKTYHSMNLKATDLIQKRRVSISTVVWLWLCHAQQIFLNTQKLRLTSGICCKHICLKVSFLILSVLSTIFLHSYRYQCGQMRFRVPSLVMGLGQNFLFWISHLGLNLENVP